MAALEIPGMEIPQTTFARLAYNLHGGARRIEHNGIGSFCSQLAICESLPLQLFARQFHFSRQQLILGCVEDQGDVRPGDDVASEFDQPSRTSVAVPRGINENIVVVTIKYY